VEAESARARRILAEGAARIDRALEAWLPGASEVPSRVHEAMRYSALAPGKRLRPALALLVAEAMGGREEDVLPCACALELLHAFSLIHDDLPAMDDDELRRGRPTSHVRFGEAIAILAGDALCCLAFELVASRTPDPARAARLVQELARAAGTAGMIGGQVLDLESEGRPPELALVSEIHARKTAALLRAACRAGALSAGREGPPLDAASRYGELLGLAFQITDDILDETATPAELGKGTRKDHKRGKLTYPACVGIPASREAAASLVAEAAELIGPHDPQGDLARLARYVAVRTA
jgi:geranylgeranyl diphosphate synthase type II